jgi:hypothetical protein
MYTGQEKCSENLKRAAWSGILDGNLGLINRLTDQGGAVIIA